MRLGVGILVALLLAVSSCGDDDTGGGSTEGGEVDTTSLDCTQPSDVAEATDLGVAEAELLVAPIPGTDLNCQYHDPNRDAPVGTVAVLGPTNERRAGSENESEPIEVTGADHAWTGSDGASGEPIVTALVGDRLLLVSITEETAGSRDAAVTASIALAEHLLGSGMAEAMSELSASPVELPDEVCDLLSADEFSSIVGTDLGRAIENTETWGCGWETVSGEGYNLILHAATEIAGPGIADFESWRDDTNDPDDIVVLDGVGDSAFAYLTEGFMEVGSGATMWTLAGDVIIEFTGEDADPDRAVEVVQALSETLLPRL